MLCTQVVSQLRHAVLLLSIVTIDLFASAPSCCAAMITPCEFDDSRLVVSSGWNRDIYALPKRTLAGTTFVALSPKDAQACLFFTGLNKGCRPFTRSAITKTLSDLVDAKIDEEFAKATGAEENVEDLEAIADNGSLPANKRFRKRWKHQHPVVEVEVPKSPGSQETRPILVSTGRRPVLIKATNANLEWLVHHIRTELGQPAEPPARRRRLIH